MVRGVDNKIEGGVNAYFNLPSYSLLLLEPEALLTGQFFPPEASTLVCDSSVHFCSCLPFFSYP